MLSNILIEKIQNSVASNGALELSDSELCVMVLKEYKKSKDKAETTKTLQLVVNSATESENVRNTMSRLFKVAYKYSNMSIISHFDKLEYTNIKGLVNLVHYIDKEHSDDSKVMRDTIKKVYSKDMSPMRYNNEIVKCIKDIKAKYKVQVSEEGDVFKVADVINSIANNISKFTDEDKAKLLDILRMA